MPKLWKKLQHQKTGFPFCVLEKILIKLNLRLAWHLEKRTFYCNEKIQVTSANNPQRGGVEGGSGPGYEFIIHYLPINMSSFPSSPNIVNSPKVISLMSLYN